jgi:hypothetical protein
MILYKPFLAAWLLGPALEFRGSSYRFRHNLASREGRPDGAFPPAAPTDRRRSPALGYTRSTP